MDIIKLVDVKKSRGTTLFISMILALGLSGQFAYADCVYQSPPVEPYGALLKSFKAMTVNVYGQDVDGIVDFVTTTDSSCQNRLREIGEHIRDARESYDIVGLQEWHSDTAATCNGVVLKNRIDDLYPDPVSGVNLGEHHYQWAHPKAYSQNDGGLGIISKTKFLWDPYTENEFASFEFKNGSNVLSVTHVETENILQFTPRFASTKPFVSWARTAHGFIFARIFLSRNPDIAVDTYVVHLTSTGSGGSKCNLQCKRGMLEQLREGIHQRSAGSGFPVLVMGDFNIGGPFDSTDPSKPCAGNDGYRDIMRNLGNPKDLWLEGGDLTLNSDEGYTHISEDKSTGKRIKKRIDYMFVPDDPYLVNSPYVITHKNPRKINHIQLSTSDHRAIIAELDIHKKINTELKNGLVTIQQKSTLRFLDAHENIDNDFRLVTRPRQQNSTQTWRVTSLGNDLFSLKQVSSLRYIDAHESQERGFSVVSRPDQGNDTQRWVIKSVGNSLFTIRQKSSDRYLDAHVTVDADFKVVTRPSQDNDTQRWIIRSLQMVNAQ